MNVFNIRGKLISDYASFVTSYINARKLVNAITRGYHAQYGSFTECI